MTVKTLLTEALDREVERSRRALQELPNGRYDWKPHDKSMILGYLANMVATIPSWITMEINLPELDVAPAAPKMPPPRLESSHELLAALERTAAEARAAFAATTDEQLMTTWKLLARGQVVQEAPRYVMILDTLSHWSHHRGQMTVYLRLLGAKVPAIFGPSADDNSFA